MALFAPDLGVDPADTRRGEDERGGDGGRGDDERGEARRLRSVDNELFSSSLSRIWAASSRPLGSGLPVPCGLSAVL